MVANTPRQSLDLIVVTRSLVNFCVLLRKLFMRCLPRLLFTQHQGAWTLNPTVLTVRYDFYDINLARCHRCDPPKIAPHVITGLDAMQALIRIPDQREQGTTRTLQRAHHRQGINAELL